MTDDQSLELELEVLEDELSDLYQEQARVARAISHLTEQIKMIRFEMSGQAALPFGDTLAG